MEGGATSWIAQMWVAQEETRKGPGNSTSSGVRDPGVCRAAGTGEGKMCAVLS